MTAFADLCQRHGITFEQATMMTGVAPRAVEMLWNGRPLHGVQNHDLLAAVDRLASVIMRSHRRHREVPRPLTANAARLFHELHGRPDPVTVRAHDAEAAQAISELEALSILIVEDGQVKLIEQFRPDPAG